MEKSERDLLICISQDMAWVKDWMVKHSQEDASNFTIINRKVDSAHKRIDWLMVVGIFSVVSLAMSIWLK